MAQDIDKAMLDHKSYIRVVLFFAVVTAMALWELRAQRRVTSIPRRVRWPSKLGLVVLNTVIARVPLPTTAVRAFAHRKHFRGLQP